MTTKINSRLPIYPNAWKTNSSQKKYENAWISIREDQVTRPDGKPGIYGVVESRIATAVVALEKDNSVWIVGQYRYPTKQYSWEVIEGGSDPEEQALDAVKRELLEEAGLKANSWLQLGAPFYLSNCFSAEVAYVYLARDLIPATTTHTDPTEDLKLMKIPFEELVERVRSGEISDALSIIAVERARVFQD